MPYKIIQTIEDSQLCLSIVPSKWEKDGILWWPKSRLQISKLLKDEHSLPDQQKWEKMTCVKKRECETYESAQHELSIMENHSDTEIEETPTVKPNNNCRTARRSATSQKPLTQLTQDFNLLVPIEPVEQSLQAATEKTADNVTVAVVYEEPVVVPNHPQPTFENDVTIVTLNETENVPKTNEEISLATIANRQNTIIRQLSDLQTSFNTLIGLISDYIMTKESEEKANKNSNATERDTSKVIIEAVNTIEELVELEEKLKNIDYFNQIVEKMVYICGSTGKKNGIDCCYKLIDYFLTREFVNKCLWTGRGAANDTKIPLKFYTNVRRCFLTIIRRADKDFSDSECENFFKRILKNSLQRTRNKIQSVHKRRPKNLQYKKREHKTQPARDEDSMVENENSINENEITDNEEIREYESDV